VYCNILNIRFINSRARARARRARVSF